MTRPIQHRCKGYEQGTQRRQPTGRSNGQHTTTANRTLDSGEWGRLAWRGEMKALEGRTAGTHRLRRRGGGQTLWTSGKRGWWKRQASGHPTVWAVKQIRERVVSVCGKAMHTPSYSPVNKQSLEFRGPELNAYLRPTWSSVPLPDPTVSVSLNPSALHWWGAEPGQLAHVSRRHHENIQNQAKTSHPQSGSESHPQISYESLSDPPEKSA